MAAEPVDVFVVDAAAPHNPVSGVLVRVYDPTGATFFTQAETDVDGKASFLLEPQGYSLRFYKFHTGFTQPQQITVLEAPETNVFEIQAEVFTLPMATDARLCRASGYFRELTGAPKRNLDMHFIARFRPVLLEDTAVVTERVKLRTDDDGYAQIDLIRCAEYEVTLEAFEDTPRLVQVPDRASVNLPDLLFPVVGEIAFDIEGPYTVAVEDELELTPTVWTTALVELEGTAVADVIWRSSDTSVLGVSVTQKTVKLYGVAAGTAELQARRRDGSIIRIPDVGIVGQPVTVTVI